MDKEQNIIVETTFIKGENGANYKKQKGANYENR